MKEKKQKIEPCLISSREGMEAVVADIVALKLTVAEKKAAMEKEVAEVQKRHMPGILEIEREIETKEAGTQVYCTQNRATLFRDKKSTDTLLAVVGFELTPHRVEKRSSKDTWEKIALRLAALKWGADFLRSKPDEVDKNALLAARADLTAEQLIDAGIKFENDEQFFIRPKSQIAAETVTTTQEAA